jgi:hypothetical protein
MLPRCASSRQDPNVPVRLAFEPSLLCGASAAPADAPPPVERHAASGVLLEPFFNRHRHLKLFARFPESASPVLNGDPAPRWVILSPGDVFQWEPGFIFRVGLFNKPHVGTPPAEIQGKPCPVCRVPFTGTTTCVMCLCGVALHCETDEKDALQCAQLRRECPVCRRPVVLTEGYLDPPSDED